MEISARLSTTLLLQSLVKAHSIGGLAPRTKRILCTLRSSSDRRTTHRTRCTVVECRLCSTERITFRMEHHQPASKVLILNPQLSTMTAVLTLSVTIIGQTPPRTRTGAEIQITWILVGPLRSSCREAFHLSMPTISTASQETWPRKGLMLVLKSVPILHWHNQTKLGL